MTDCPDRFTTALADPCRAERELGAGGMATVGPADDFKHNRRAGRKIRGSTPGPGAPDAEVG